MSLSLARLLASHRLRAAVPLAGLSTYLLAAVDVTAQDALARGGAACENGRIASIDVERHQIFDDSVGQIMSKVVSLANWLHVDTRESVIRRELLFREGDCVDPLRLSESERLLRNFSFLQSASIDAERNGDGDIEVSVATRDDWSLRLEPRFDFGSGLGFTGIALAERNLGGTGRSVELAFINRTGTNAIGGTFFDPQFLGTRWNLGLAVFGSEPGWSVRTVIGHPFVGLVGHRAAFGDALYADRWFRYIVGDHDQRIERLLPTRGKAAQIGGALRLASVPRDRATKLATYGLTVSYDFAEYGRSFFQSGAAAERSGVTEDQAARTTTAVLRPQRILRLNFVVGIRGLDYVKRRALSTLGAEEDIARGASADLVLGLAARAFGSGDDQFFTALDLYGGSRVLGPWFSMLRGSFEGRRDYERRRWQDIFAAVQWSNFWLLANQTIELTGLFSAGWETTVPFQLTLGGPRLLAGYPSHRFPGGMRAVVRLEDRAHWFTLGGLADLGTVVFADLGRMWANGAVFATNSGLRSSVGAGIRIATPTGSRQTFRLDFALPVESGVKLSDMVITFTTRRPLRLEGRPIDAQLQRSRDFGLRSALQHFK